MSLITTQAIRTLRVNVKSLSSESKIIRREVTKTTNPHIKNVLYYHKIFNVRQESRSAQLALACLKNIPYCEVEKLARTKPNWKRIIDKIKLHIRLYQYTDKEEYENELEKFANWKLQAEIYINKINKRLP